MGDLAFGSVRLPFDGTDFEPRPPAPPPRPRRVSKRDESILLWLALAFVLGLLVLPISADAFVDIVRFVQGPPHTALPAAGATPSSPGRKR